MLAVVLGALKTALDTEGPWYDATASFWVYGMTLIGGLVLLSVTALAAVVLVRTRGPENIVESTTTPKPDRTEPPSDDVADAEIEELLTSLERTAGALKGTAEPRREGAASAQTRSAFRQPRRAHTRPIVLTLLGPIVAATVFGATSAALLPAAGSMLQSAFTINTFVILSLSYGWAGLIPYTLASLFLAATHA